MANTKNLQGSDHESVLLIGTPGSGKTTQFRTLAAHGKMFLYVFDPNALSSLEGADIEYEMFSPDLLDINVRPLSNKAKADRIIQADEPTTYPRWEKHFDEAYNSGFFDKFDYIGIDSFTTFSDAVMDRVLYLNGRLGKQPEQDDWSAQMITIQNVARTLSTLTKLFVATAHEEVRQDELTKRVFWQPVLTGRLRTRIPLLFSNIFRCVSDQGQWFFDTVSDREHQYVRTSIKGLEPEIDVTIKDFERAGDYGLGAILKKSGKLTRNPVVPPAGQNLTATGKR